METLSSSLEDYLEAILFLINKKGEARTKDIAGFMNVKMPSVNKALKKLAEKGFLIYDPYNNPKFTDKGKRRASLVYSRHTKIKDFIKLTLCSTEKIAEQNACRLEHVLDKELIEKLGFMADFLNVCEKDCTRIKKLKSKLKNWGKK